MILQTAPNFPAKPLSIALAVALHAMAAQAQTAAPATGTLNAVTVEASADASAAGLSRPYAGGQVARGGRLGILGNQDIMDTPFSTTNFTQELIQNQQARSIGDVLQNDPAVRVARGFGNYQQVYIVRGLPVYSDDMAYNGLYGLLPRQYLAAELVERVEVLRGASAFLNGAAPGGSGLGGAINVMPKRAGSEPLTTVTLGLESGTSGYAALDLSRRFGPDNSVGIRVNAVRRDGKTDVNFEKRETSLLSVGMDYRSSNLRVSADLGYQDYQLHGAQPSVTFAAGVPITSAPKASRNIGQPWTYSTERDTFGTARAEYDLNSNWTVWGALGARHGDETNDLANPTVQAGGALNYLRFTGTRADRITTGEVGLRGNFRTGDIGHTVVLSAASYHAKMNAPFAFSNFAGTTAGTLYAPVVIAPDPVNFFTGTTVSDQRTRSIALADTLSLMQDQLLITLGLRRQGFVDTGYDQSRVTPVVGAVFKVNKQVSMYASYVEGLVKGDIAPATYGFAPALPTVNGGQVFAPYQTKQTEIGVKYDGGRVGGTLSVFNARKPTYSVNFATGVFSQTDRQRNTGGEISVFGEAAPGVRLLGGASFLKAVMDSGNRAIGSPKAQYNAGVEWDVPGLRGLSLEGRVVHTSSQFADTGNTQSVPSWTRVDLGARYITEVAGKAVTFRARMENAANKDYWASVGGYPGAGYLVLGAPRTVSLNASVDF
ncbi:MAG: TonB-dependent receptor [Comamonadaceae bacterium]|nr:MAG: TonB-dependent receptor [Comamonadaceae bacterium]